MADSAVNRTDLDEKIEVNQNSLILKTAEVAAKARFSAVSVVTSLLENGKSAKDIMNVGFFLNESQLREDKATGDGTIEWVYESGKDTEIQAITGVATVADIFKLVYVTDNQTLTTVKPANGTPVGYVKRFRSAGIADMHIFSEAEAVIMGYSGNESMKTAAHITAFVLEGTSKITLSEWIADSTHVITDMYAVKMEKDAGSIAGSQNISLEHDPGTGFVAIATSQVLIAFGDAQGARILLTAAMGANVISRGEKVRLVLDASGTGFTAAQLDKWDVKIHQRYQPGG